MKIRLLTLFLLMNAAIASGASITIDQTGPPNSGGTIQGSLVNICISLEDDSLIASGFDFVVAFDREALTLHDVQPGSVFSEQEWEYFTYRVLDKGICTNGCPDVILRIVGFADLNDGNHHPNSYVVKSGDTFACMQLMVNRTTDYGCMFKPIKWFWLDCYDNVVASYAGDTMYTSASVYDYLGGGKDIRFDKRLEITGNDQTFPTFTGAPMFCDTVNHSNPRSRKVDFNNGGIKLICGGPIDVSGDINLNGLENEIADADMFVNYYVKGRAAFNTHPDGSIAASETNGDGIPLTIADLVYLIRNISENAKPKDELKHTIRPINIVESDGVISTETALGGALFVFSDSVDVQLLADNMRMQVGYVDGKTQAIVYPAYPSAERIAPGEIIYSDGELKSVEIASYDGIAFGPVIAHMPPLPEKFYVYQNFPNPFNPVTTVRFDLTEKVDAKVEIYNVSGQLIESFNGPFVVGRNEVVWDASDFASGVYLYKVTAGVNSQSRKMVLLK